MFCQLSQLAKQLFHLPRKYEVTAEKVIFVVQAVFTFLLQKSPHYTLITHNIETTVR